MLYYSNVIRELLKGYNGTLKSISDYIKKIGGTGTIHGCIVDIDFLNHIYVNPEDGTITPYFALSTVDKYFFNNVTELLLEKRPDLYDNYLNLLDSQSQEVLLLNGEIKGGSIAETRYISDTHMYNPSRIMKSLQYLTEVNVIRIWNDRIFEPHIPSNHTEIDI
ncbi:hypothetical protein [Rossellomorea aquimaris]|uniref:hypothetical protein n=1 Tax=Rossellomorea aquimaris TaxID=189382 RepID=UPI0007D062AC|nr:hypothetical protein [Rossellomorea aquimaris]